MIYVRGDTIDGYRYDGPFKDFEEAETWALTHDFIWYTYGIDCMSDVFPYDEDPEDYSDFDWLESEEDYEDWDDWYYPYEDEEGESRVA